MHPATIRSMTILGCLASTPESRVTGERKRVTVFSLATYHRDQTGVEQTDYTRAVAFEKVGEQVLKAEEGDFVYAQGEYRDRRWDDKGTTKVTQELTVTSFRILTPSQAHTMQQILSDPPADPTPQTDPQSVPGTPPAGKTMENAAQAT